MGGAVPSTWQGGAGGFAACSGQCRPSPGKCCCPCLAAHCVHTTGFCLLLPSVTITTPVALPQALFVCLFVCLVHGLRKLIALLRMEPMLPEGFKPSRAGRHIPFCVLDTDPSLGRAPGEFALQGSRGPQNGGLGRSCARTELGVFVAVLRNRGPRFVRLVPHCTTPHSQLLNMET